MPQAALAASSRVFAGGGGGAVAAGLALALLLAGLVGDLVAEHVRLLGDDVLEALLELGLELGAAARLLLVPDLLLELGVRRVLERALVLLRGFRVALDLADEVGAGQGDGLRRELVEQAADDGRLPLVLRAERVLALERVVVRLRAPGHEDRVDAARVADEQGVLEGPEPRGAGRDAAGERVRQVRRARLRFEGGLVDLDAVRVRAGHGEHAALGEVEGRRRPALQARLPQGPEGPRVPDLEQAVDAAGGQVRTARAVRQRRDAAPVGEHARQGLRRRRRPEGDDAVAVAHVEHAALGILGQRVRGAEARRVLRDERPRGHVVVLEVAAVAHGREQEVEGQKAQVLGLEVLLHAVDLGAGVVVDVDVLLLRAGEHGLVVEEDGGAHALAGDDLALGRVRVEVEHRGAAAVAREERVAARAAERHAVGAEGQRVLPGVDGRVARHGARDLFLLDLVRALRLRLGLEQAGLVGLVVRRRLVVRRPHGGVAPALLAHHGCVWCGGSPY
mmetsp:Transcript_17665/g.57617  ORF Transcript_17665/g.57617 Transcript_17665/m.57617 type:complete len:506 (-) Transcript_17665:44-1561(-)